MKIIFIGAGNVATHLACELNKYNYEIIQVYSQTILSAQSLADKVNSIATNDIKSIMTDADLYIFSVKDSVLSDLISHVPRNSGIWLHTAGSMPLDIFKDYIPNYAVLYPFQTFSKERNLNWKEIPIFLEASDTETFQKLENICLQLSNRVQKLSSEQRKYIHLTGVFACNFTNYMYSISAEILARANLPFDVVLPLIDETCTKVHTLSPIEAQTGPAIRFDENVMNKHLDLIEDENIKEIYRLISEKIHQTHKTK